MGRRRRFPASQQRIRSRTQHSQMRNVPCGRCHAGKGDGLASAARALGPWDALLAKNGVTSYMTNVTLPGRADTTG